MRRRGTPSPRGFTLIEAIASMVVVTILGSSTAFVLVNAAARAADAVTAAQLHAELSIGLDRIDHELRNMQVRSGMQGLPDIAAVTPSSVQWNGNSSLSLSNGRLMLVEAGAPAAVLLDDVSSLIVQTYDQDNAALATTLSGSECDPIRRVSVQVTLFRNGVSQSLRCKTFLRCTMELAGS